MADQQMVEIKIPEELSSRERKQFALEIIETIRARTESGIGVRKAGSGYTTYKYPGYSQSYIESAAFKAYGKSASRIDLTLSGDMLNALMLLDHWPGSVVIGFRDGTEENAKAEGNQLGSYGGSPNPRKARKFLGATKQEIDEALEAIGDV